MKKTTMMNKKTMQTRVYESVVALKNVLAENGGEIVAERLEWSGCSINDLEEEAKNLINLYERGNVADKIAFRCVITKGCWHYENNAWQFFMPATRDCMAVWKEARKSIRKGIKLGVEYWYDDPSGYSFDMVFTLDGKEKEMINDASYHEEECVALREEIENGLVLINDYDTFPTATD